MKNLIQCHRGTQCPRHLGTVPVHERCDIGDHADTGILQVLTGKDANHARCRGGLGGVDVSNQTMANRCAQKCGVKLSFKAGVIGIGAVSNQKPRVLATGDML